tara:strand:- start:316 stop:1548 length:1233 start_codon:yes stop_codon:yes gene_type:complete
MAEDKGNFLKDNLYLLSGALVINVFGFLFHFYMGRELGPEIYGVLAVLMAFMGILGIPYATLQLSISRYVAKFKIRKEEGKLRYLYKASLRKLNRLFLLLFIALLFVDVFLAKFWRIDYSLLALTSLMVLVMPFISVTRGFLQGLQKFKALGVSLSYEGLVKFFLSVLLVVVGFSVGGALVGVLASYLVAGIYSYNKISEYRTGNAEKFFTKKLYAYTMPVLFTLLLFTAFYSFDLLLVKHFFSDLEAGYFAVVSVLGKIIFFASFSVVQVMFPKVVELSEAKKQHRDVLIKSMLLISVIVAPIILLYFLFGGQIISLLFGEEYLPVASLLGFYGIFMALVSLSKLFCFYLLSLKRYFFIFLLALFAILELVLITMLHQSLTQIITILISLGVGLFLILGVISLFGKEND